MRAMICDILYQGTDCHFKQLACALNHSCLQLERRSSFPVSSTTLCYCLSLLRRRAGLALSDTDTQIPPDSRMNPSSKHPARLSLGRLLFRLHWSQGSSESFPDLPPLTSQTASRRLLSQHLHATTAHCRLLRPRDSPHTCQFPAGSIKEGTTFRKPRASTTPIASKHRQAGLHRRAELSGMSAHQGSILRHDSGRLSLLPPLLPGDWTPKCLYLLTPSAHQPDSYRTPFAFGTDPEASEHFLAQCGQGFNSRPQTAHATKGVNLTSMSGYDKNQQYVYGK
jgi:hypothetical protein